MRQDELELSDVEASHKKTRDAFELEIDGGTVLTLKNCIENSAEPFPENYHQDFIESHAAFLGACSERVDDMAESVAFSSIGSQTPHSELISLLGEYRSRIEQYIKNEGVYPYLLTDKVERNKYKKMSKKLTPKTTAG